MRFLFIVYRDFENPSATGGDFYFWELAKGLARLNHNVVIICSSFDGRNSVEITEGVEIVRLKGYLSLSLKIFREYLRRGKGSFDFVLEEVIGGQRLPFFGVFYIKNPLIAVWHQRNTKIFREQYPSFIAFLLGLFELSMARLYRKQIIITPSKGAKRNLTALGLKSNNIKVVYDGVSKELRNIKINSNRENMVIVLGKMRRYKRFDHALLAFERVQNVFKKPSYLVIAGKASEIDKGYIEWLEKLAKRLGIEKYVKFRINISEKEKKELLSKARLLVQPSPVEGFSIVVAEANSCGTPVVVSDGVPGDVVINDYNGFVYPFGKIELFAQKITLLLEDETIWNRLSRNSYEWSKKFTWENSVSQLLEIILFCSSFQ